MILFFGKVKLGNIATGSRNYDTKRDNTSMKTFGNNSQMQGNHNM